MINNALCVLICALALLLTGAGNPSWAGNVTIEVPRAPQARPAGSDPNGAGTPPQPPAATKATLVSESSFCEDCGFGPALVWTRFNSENVIAASTHGVAGGPVRVDESNKSSIGLWFEAHYWFHTFGASDPAKHKFGWGPFITVQVGSNADGESGTIFSSFGLGMMFGALRPSTSTTIVADKFDAAKGADVGTGGAPTPRQSWNIGIGVASNPIQRLGDGIVEGQPLPSGISDVYYKKTRVYSPFIIFSWAFE